MDNINIGHILAWIFVALLLAGYLVWQQTHDRRIKKRAKALRESCQAIPIKIVEIKLGRYGVDRFVFEYENNDKTMEQEHFVPRTFFAELGFLTLEIGENAKLYTSKIKPGEAAWIDVRDHSFWGYLGPRNF